jgi:hypothetical protein
MTTVLDENVHNFAVDGTSDDLDVPIKERAEVKLFHTLPSLHPPLPKKSN